MLYDPNYTPPPPSSDDVPADVSDIVLLQAVVVSLQRRVEGAKINKSQCRVLHRRLRVIYDMLLRMPKREPTPQLLSIFRAAEFTVGRMGLGRWRHVLVQRFTCTDLFECLRSRMREVWSLHSTASWEKDDQTAVLADEQTNLDMIMSDQVMASMLLEVGAPTLSSDLHNESEGDKFVNTEQTSSATQPRDELRRRLLHYYRRRHASQWKVLSFEVCPAQLLPDEFGDPVLVDGRDRQWETQSLFAIPPPEVSNAHMATSADVDPQAVNVLATQPAVDSPLFHNSSLLTVTAAGTGDGVEMYVMPSSFHNTSSTQEHANVLPAPATPGLPSVGTLAARFAVRYEGLTYRGQNVVVKRLADPMICPGTLESFVMDSAVRARWSHPNLLTTHGSFCEEFDEEGIPHLSLGLVMTNVCSAPERYIPLQRLLYFDGRRFSLLDAIDVTLQVADALQFALFDQKDVPKHVSDRWCWVSPSNVFLLDTHAPADDLTDCASVAMQDMNRRHEDTGLLEVQMGRYMVKYSPPLYVEGGGLVSRWAPHPQAVKAETYALAQLFLALTTNLQPYHHIPCQLELQSLYAAATVPNSDSSCLMPRGIEVPHTLPIDVQLFVRSAMTIQSTNTEVVSTKKTIRTLQEFRLGLHALRSIALRLPQLPNNAATSFTVETPVDDYGWILHRAFDAHAA